MGQALLFRPSRGVLTLHIMAAFEAVERLQKFDWLIQKLHSLRSSFNSEQGLQELQKLHALQLLHRNGIQFNEQLGESEEDRIIQEKISGVEEDPEGDEDLDDIEEDTEVLDDEYEDNDDQSPEPNKPETIPTITSNGSPGPQLFSSPPAAPHKNGISVAEPEFPKQESGESDQSQQNQTGQKYSRFSTGLFPPLPFDPAFLAEESPLKVGKFVGKIPNVLLASAYQIRVKLSEYHLTTLQHFSLDQSARHGLVILELTPDTN